MRTGATISTVILFLLSISACDSGGDKAMEHIDEKAEETVPPATKVIDALAARVETQTHIPRQGD